MLGPAVPDTVNCTDSKGQKQGWWIYYEVLYNPVDIPAELAQGDYVDSYTYGKYQNDMKIGSWRTISNVHLIWERRHDHYYYAQDTVLVTSNYCDGGCKTSTTYYNSDSTIISYSVTFEDHFTGKKVTVKIDCDDSGSNTSESCEMTYRGERITTFPIDKFYIETRKAVLIYELERKQIDHLLDN